MYGTATTDLEYLAQLQINDRTAAAWRTRLRRSLRRTAATRTRRLAAAR